MVRGLIGSCHEESYAILTRVSKSKRGCRLPNEVPDKWNVSDDKFGKVILKVKIKD